MKRIIFSLLFLAASVAGAQTGALSIVSSSYFGWRAPVADVGSLPTCDASSHGNVRATLDDGKIYTCLDGTGWVTASGAGDGVGYDEVLEDGAGLTKRAQLNMIGASVTCVDNGGATRTDCTFTDADTVFIPDTDPGVDHSGYVAGHGDGANCSAGNYPLGVDAAGAVQNCTADADTIFTPNADPGVDHSSYVAGHGDGANCSSGNYPLGVDAAGAVQSCTTDDDVPESGDFGAAVDLEADGSVSANAVALTTDTTGNYMSGIAAGLGLSVSHTPAEGSTGTVNMNWGLTLAGNPALGVREAVFSTCGTGGAGILIEGSVADDFEACYQLPDLVGADATRTIVTQTATQTLTNKTIVTPIIASFSSATHTHADAAGGGQFGIANHSSSTSANLAGVLSNETGTGFVVFSADPALTGNPTVPTAAGGDNDTSAASTAFVTSAVSTHAAIASAHHTKTVDASELSAGTIPAARVGADHIDDLAEIADLCAAQEIVKRNAGDTAWECAPDATGGSPSFDLITSGTNISAAMVIGSGASIEVGGGTIESTVSVTEVHNDTGATIPKCAAVFISGFNVSADLPEIEVADADTVDDGSPAIGLILADIDDATSGYVAVSGQITSADTSTGEGWSSGDPLYVNASGTAATSDCGESLTNVRPTGDAVGIQKIGVVGRVHGATGTVEVNLGRANDIPNLADDSVWVGSSTDFPTTELMPDTDGATLALGWDQTTNAFTTQTHVGSSVSSDEIETDTIVAADVAASLDTKSFCVYIENPVSSEQFATVWRAPTAVTAVEIYCEATGGTSVDFDFDVDDGTPAGINGSDITCDTSGVTDSTLAGDTTLADGDRLDIDIGTVTGAVTGISLCLEYTID